MRLGDMLGALRSPKYSGKYETWVDESGGITADAFKALIERSRAHSHAQAQANQAQAKPPSLDSFATDELVMEMLGRGFVVMPMPKVGEKIEIEG